MAVQKHPAMTTNTIQAHYNLGLICIQDWGTISDDMCSTCGNGRKGAHAIPAASPNLSRSPELPERSRLWTEGLAPAGIRGWTEVTKIAQALAWDVFHAPIYSLLFVEYTQVQCLYWPKLIRRGQGCHSLEPLRCGLTPCVTIQSQPARSSQFRFRSRANSLLGASSRKAASS